MNIAVLASGTGTNLQALLDATRDGRLAGRVCSVISNRSNSGASERAHRHGVPFSHLSSRTHPDPDRLDQAICETLEESGADLVFLAGYLKKIGPATLARFAGRILNTHPALLPKFGGRGMYGRHVHEAVLDAGETVSGVSIHLVDPEYDAGQVIAQARVPVLPEDTPNSLAERVMTRERAFVVETLTKVASGELSLSRGEVSSR